MPAAMREGIVTIMVLLLLLFCLKKMNWPLCLFCSPMSAAAACTCLMLEVGMVIATHLGSPGCLFFSSLAGGGGSFFSSCGGGGAAKMALTVPVSSSFLSCTHAERRGAGRGGVRGGKLARSQSERDGPAFDARDGSVSRI
jgi:hypothetical protein